MDVMTSDPRSVATGPATRRAVEHGGLICRIEGELKGSSGFSRCSEGMRAVHTLEASVVGGPYAGEKLTGLDEFTIRPDGTVRMAGAQTSSSGRLSLALQLLGSITPAAGLEWPSPQAMARPGYEFPDADLPLRGTALLRATDEDRPDLDGVTATIEGWLNFESGELEVEARVV